MVRLNEYQEKIEPLIEVVKKLSSPTSKSKSMRARKSMKDIASNRMSKRSRQIKKNPIPSQKQARSHVKSKKVTFTKKKKDQKLIL
jgi:hypothetical protein